MERTIHSGISLCARRIAANLIYRMGADSWVAPAGAVISHPKSGRTWLRVMLAEAGIEPVRFSHAGSSEDAAMPSAAFAPLTRFWRDKRILLLTRDPRDTIVSFYFQATRRNRVYSGTLTEFLQDPQFGIERAIQFNLLWLRERSQFAAFRMLSYEQLHEDPKAALQQAALFLLGREINDASLRRAAAAGTFAALRQMELSGEGRKRWGMRLSPGNSSDPESFKTRRGLIEGWRDYFSEEDRHYAFHMLRQYNYFRQIEVAESESRLVPLMLNAAA